MEIIHKKVHSLYLKAFYLTMSLYKVFFCIKYLVIEVSTDWRKSMKTVLAFDLGATSARGIVYSIKNNQLVEHAVYRFTGYQLIDQQTKEIRWNIDKIIQEIQRIIGIANTNYPIQSIGFDSWGCDFGLLNASGELIQQPLCYQTMMQEQNQHYGQDLPDYFRMRTGISNASINTSSQLLYLKDHYPELLKEAESLLMIPDLIHYLLVGAKLSESSIASTSQLFDLKKQYWAVDLIEELGVSPTLFSTIVLPYTQIGMITVGEKNIPIHSVMSHDTASAIYALPTNETAHYFLSSGTWSILGQKTESGLLLQHTLQETYSYEQSGDGKLLKLKNLLGMWFIEEALQSINKKKSISIEEIQQLLENVSPVPFFFDTEDPQFLGKGTFLSSLKSYGDTRQFPSLESAESLFLTIYQNLACKYAQVFRSLMGKQTQPIFLFGGGSKSQFLTQLTADLTHCPVTVCDSESSALGNAFAQFFALKELRTREDLVKIITRYHPSKVYLPQSNQAFEQLYQQYQKFIESNYIKGGKNT